MSEIMDAKEGLNNTPEKQNGSEDILDTMLFHVGEMGRYQWLLFFGMAPFFIVFAFVYFVQMFVAATPQNHWCRVPELQHLDQELRRNLSAPGAILGGEWDRCATFDTNWSLVLETLQPPGPETPLRPCHDGWEFQLTDIPYHTVVSERGWVCEYSGYAPIAQALFFVGALVGGLIFGWLADTYGRIPAVVGSNLIGFVGSVASVFTTGMWDFTLARFLVGMSYDTCMMMVYILVLEYVGPRHRTLVANMAVAIFFGGGCLALPWLAYFIADWRMLLWVTSLPMLTALAVPFAVPESARWLASKGRVHQAVEAFRRFEKVNKTKIPQDVLDDFIVSAGKSRNSEETITSLFRNPSLRVMMTLCVVGYMVTAIVFDALVRMSEGLGTDFFVTFTLTSATEIPSVTIVALVLDRWGRRSLTYVPLTLTGILTLIAAFMPRGIPQVTLAIIARFCVNMTYNTVIQWSTELLPTAVRASGSSLIHVSGYIATGLSPFVVYSERIWRPLPLLIIGAVSLLGAGSAIFLPETMNRPMPQTIADGERLFREHHVCGNAKGADDDWSPEEENKLKTVSA